jgi:hypothetical protein
VQLRAKRGNSGELRASKNSDFVSLKQPSCAKFGKTKAVKRCIQQMCKVCCDSETCKEHEKKATGTEQAPERPGQPPCVKCRKNRAATCCIQKMFKVCCDSDSCKGHEKKAADTTEARERLQQGALSEPAPSLPIPDRVESRMCAYGDTPSSDDEVEVVEKRPKR